MINHTFHFSYQSKLNGTKSTYEFIQPRKKIQFGAFIQYKIVCIVFSVSSFKSANGIQQDIRSRIKQLFTWFSTIFLVVKRCWKSYNSVTSFLISIKVYLTICLSFNCGIQNGFVVINPIGSIFENCKFLTFLDIFNSIVLINLG